VPLSPVLLKSHAIAPDRPSRPTLFGRLIVTGRRSWLALIRRILGRRAVPPPSPVAAAPPSAEIARLQELLDGVGVGLFALAADGRIDWANRAARGFAGEAVSRLADIPAFGPEVADTILALPLGGRELVTLADGRTVLVWAGSFAASTDTAQRLVSIQVMSGALDADQVEAWHAMTRTLAEEMMTALTPIVALSDNLRHLAAEVDRAPPELAAAIDTIARRSGHLTSFVARYRTLAEPAEPVLASLDLATLRTAITATAGPPMRQRGIAFDIDFPKGERMIRADPDQLQQALHELLDNAAEAVAGTAQPSIILACRDQGDGIAISVRDNGPGVPPDAVEDLFVPFVSHRPDGSGIGLTLARRIAIAHRGSLTARVNRDGGMTFAFTLPGGDSRRS